MANVTIDGIEVEVADDATVLEAARAAGCDVPTLCFDDRQDPFGACRVCLVGIEGARAPLPSCTTIVRDGMVVDTRDERARRIASNVVDLVLSELPHAPDPDTELARVAAGFGFGAGHSPRWPGATHVGLEAERNHPYLAFDHDMCISCGRCVRACDEVQGTFALATVGRGFTANVVAGLDQGFRDSVCVSCGACADTCPTHAIWEVA
ncbi:MAG TPA: 2Fe-2S iron-sulfur cluster-binding protein [Solirubrobacteraceae bacterium]|jgi:predicted molibdopterin-dependent oxidoreductase YjgC|nr:2Fe-2S iron-sulfur cluster-binding protein [Solirubrobacteraceae bacterium]